MKYFKRILSLTIAFFITFVFCFGILYYQESQNISKIIYPIGNEYYGYTIDYSELHIDQPHEPGLPGFVLMDYDTANKYATDIEKNLKIKIFRAYIAQAAGGTWTLDTSFPGNGRAFSFIFKIDDDVYIGGGEKPADILYKDMYRWRGGIWTQMSDYDTDIRRAEGFAFDGDGYVAGGLTGADGATLTAKTMKYYVNNNTFNDTHINDLPWARYSLCSFVINDVPYIVGGHGAGGSRTDDVISLQIDGNWTSESDFPITITDAAAATYEGEGYVIGGKSQFNAYVGTTYSYNPTTKIWTNRSNIPISTAVGVAIVLHDYLYYGLGGYATGQNGYFYKYTISDGWSDLTTMPDTRSAPVAWTHGDSFYVTTGSDDSGTHVNTTYRFDDYSWNLSGYVKDIDGGILDGALVSSSSSSSNTSNTTGYYTMPDENAGTYTLTTTLAYHNTNTTSISLSSDTTLNITLIPETPTLSNTVILDASETELRIGWQESILTDFVKVYRDSDTNLIGTEYTTYGFIDSYTDTNLNSDTGYNFWLEPWDGSVSGSKYYVSGTTDGDGGGGGGGGGDPIPTATSTPGPTAPPWTNITDEDWLNLIRYEQEYILFEHDQLNITIGTYTPKPVNLSFWYLILFLGICSTAYGSQKKNGEVLFVVGLVSVFISMIKLGLF